MALERSAAIQKQVIRLIFRRATDPRGMPFGSTTMSVWFAMSQLIINRRKVAVGAASRRDLGQMVLLVAAVRRCHTQYQAFAWQEIIIVTMELLHGDFDMQFFFEFCQAGFDVVERSTLFNLD